MLKGRNVAMGGNNSIAIGAKGSARKAKKPLVEVLGRQSLGKNASVSVVRAGGRTLVLGIGESGVTLLTELETELEEPEVAETQTTPTLLSVPTVGVADTTDVFKNILDQVRERTVRKIS